MSEGEKNKLINAITTLISCLESERENNKSLKEKNKNLSLHLEDSEKRVAELELDM